MSNIDGLIVFGATILAIGIVTFVASLIALFRWWFRADRQREVIP